MHYNQLVTYMRTNIYMISGGRATPKIMQAAAYVCVLSNSHVKNESASANENGRK